MAHTRGIPGDAPRRLRPRAPTRRSKEVPAAATTRLSKSGDVVVTKLQCISTKQYSSVVLPSATRSEEGSAMAARRTFAELPRILPINAGGRARTSRVDSGGGAVVPSWRRWMGLGRGGAQD